MGILFKLSIYTIAEGEFYNNTVPNIFLPEYSKNIIIDTLVHTPFKFKDMYPKIYHR